MTNCEGLCKGQLFPRYLTEIEANSDEENTYNDSKGPLNTRQVSRTRASKETTQYHNNWERVSLTFGQ